MSPFHGRDRPIIPANFSTRFATEPRALTRRAASSPGTTRHGRCLYSRRLQATEVEALYNHGTGSTNASNYWTLQYLLNNPAGQ